MCNNMNYKGVLEVETCASCGTKFAIEAHLMASLRKNGNTFYCPNGHSLHYGNSVSEQLEEERNEKIKLRKELDRKSLQLNSIKSGVCPICKKKFVDVYSHMKNKHPKFLEVKNVD